MTDAWAVAERGRIVRPPVVTALFVLVSAGLSLTFPGERWADALVWHRGAIEAGELWRLWTGQLVHHGASHTLWDLLVLAGLGVWLEHRSRAVLLWVAGASATGAAAVVFVLRPDVDVYLGSSGIGAGLWVAVAITILREASNRSEWLVAWGALCFVPLQIGLALQGLWPEALSAEGLPTVVEAHLGGALAGAVVAPWWCRSHGSRSRGDRLTGRSNPLHRGIGGSRPAESRS